MNEKRIIWKKEELKSGVTAFNKKGEELTARKEIPPAEWAAANLNNIAVSGERLGWNMESHGTRSFIRIFPWLLLPLTDGGVAIVDELDIAIHPLLLPEILQWYRNPSQNKLNAQLWMTCHSAPLMEELSKEEIILCEKDRRGRSSAFSLMDMRAVRRSDNLYKKYLGGEYGAVPHIG